MLERVESRLVAEEHIWAAGEFADGTGGGLSQAGWPRNGTARQADEYDLGARAPVAVDNPAEPLPPVLGGAPGLRRGRVQEPAGCGADLFRGCSGRVCRLQGRPVDSQPGHRSRRIDEVVGPILVSAVAQLHISDALKGMREEGLNVALQHHPLEDRAPEGLPLDRRCAERAREIPSVAPTEPRDYVMQSADVVIGVIQRVLIAV